MKYFSDKEWFSLPLVERQRWWETTDYGRKRPSQRVINRYVELLTEIKTANA